jgi:hypothetical protein
MDKPESTVLTTESMNWEVEEFYFRDAPWDLLNDPRLTTAKKLTMTFQPATSAYWPNIFLETEGERI